MRRMVVFAMLLLQLLLSSCAALPGREPEVLGDLAYSRNQEPWQYTVCIPEGEDFVPYLVLTRDYGGNCLLLRQQLLEEFYIYNPHMTGGASYYENSAVDRMLNTEFAQRFPRDISSKIVPTSIWITARDCLGGQGEEQVISISRSFFLLSASEVSNLRWRTAAQEGETLDYFDSDDRRIAETPEGVPASWWLRTPNRSEYELVHGVDRNGVVGIGGANSYDPEHPAVNGVRPAFCLPADLPIFLEDGKYCLLLQE